MDDSAIFGPRPPIDGEIVLDVSTTAQVVRVPDGWGGRQVEVTPHGASVALRFGTSTTTTVTYDAAASVDATTKVITPHAESGRRFVDGYPRLLRFPEAPYVFLGIDGSGTGKLSLARVGNG